MTILRVGGQYLSQPHKLEKPTAIVEARNHAIYCKPPFFSIERLIQGNHTTDERHAIGGEYGYEKNTLPFLEKLNCQDAVGLQAQQGRKRSKSSTEDAEGQQNCRRSWTGVTVAA